MDRNTIVGFLLIATILIGWSYFTAPSKEEIEAQRRKQDSLRVATSLEKERENGIIEYDTISQTQIKTAETIDIVAIDSDTIIPQQRLGAFSHAQIGEEKLIHIENDLMKLTASNKGGALVSLEVKNYKKYNGDPLFLFEGEDNTFNLSFFSDNKDIHTKSLFFEPFFNGLPLDSTHLLLGDNDSLVLSFRLYSEIDSLSNHKSNNYLEFVYTLRPQTHIVDFDIHFIGLQDVISRNTSYVNFEWFQFAPSQEKSIENERAASTVYFKYLVDDVDYISERKDAKMNLNNKVKWIAHKQQFFSSVIIAKDAFLNAEIETITDKETDYVKQMKSSIGIPFENTENFSFNMGFYFGPNHFKTLEAYELSLEKLVPLGWGIFSWINRFLVIPVFSFLNSFNMNYGIIILLLTIFIKILLFPIAYKTYASSAKMRILKPDIEEINEKFPKKEDALKKQQAVMALYKKAGVNPMAGCLPMLLQLPILIALFRFFPASFELRQEAFLWADDLSTYDSILDLPFTIPFYGDHVSLFTLLMTISTIIYTKMNNDMMGSTNQMPGMKTMMYIMPVMFLGIFNNFAAGLSYYYFLTNIITFVQMFIFRFIIDEEALKKKIEANKLRKINVKKSGFQKRLEDMAKQRGYKPKK